MYKIFIIEDDRDIGAAVAEHLTKWEMDVTLCSDFHNLLQEFAECAPDLVLVDIMLPVMNGYHWCAEIRKISKVPIIFISSASDNMNIVMAMNMGADDFIAKPFDVDVLVAKVQALLRRTYHFGNEMTPLLECKGARLNTADQSVTFEGNKIELTKNEYRILLTLMQNKGVVVSREKLMDELWQTDAFVDDNALTVNMGRLRKKLESAGLKDFIETKFGGGYIIAQDHLS